MNFIAPIFPALFLLYGIIVLWYVSMEYRKRGDLGAFKPLFLWSILINAAGSLIYYQMVGSFWWFILDWSFIICYTWLLVVLIRVIHGRL